MSDESDHENLQGELAELKQQVAPFEGPIVKVNAREIRIRRTENDGASFGEPHQATGF